MGDIARLLEPISPENPAGVYLYHATEFDQIKEARRQDDTSPRHEWEREIKTSDYKLVARLCEEALISKTKDLRLAVWLAHEELWRAAAEIARRRGMNVVCRSLRLDANSLKQWMGQDSGPTKAKRRARKHTAETPAHFVELFTPAASGGSSCMVEVDSASGGKLRVE